MGRLRVELSGAAVARGVLAALLAYAVVLIVCLLPGRPLDPTEDESALYAVTILASLIASAAGTAAGAWQARAAGTRAPIAGLALGAVTVVVCGVLLTAANGGTSDTGDALIHLAHPLGAALGAVLYGRRWLAAPGG